MKRNRTIAYAPLPAQLQFHKLGCRFKGFSGPVGSGKSKALCYEAIRLCYVNAGRVGLLGAPTYNMLRDSTLTSLIEVLHDNEVPFEHNKADQYILLKETHSKILLRSLSNSSVLRGTNLAWFGIDELTYANEESWRQLEARLRDPKAISFCGFGVWTPNGHNWVYKKFFKGTSEYYAVVTSKPYENTHLLSKNVQYYDLLRGSYTEAQYRQEVLGEYDVLSSDCVYREFDRNRNVLASNYSATVPLLWAFDFNVDPMCSIVAQGGKDGMKIIGEIVLRRSGTEEMCLEFLHRFGQHNGEIRIYGDASGNARSTKGWSDYEIVRRVLANNGMRRFNLIVPTKNPPVRERVAQVNAMFKSASGVSRLWIDPGCVELVKDLEELRFKEGTSIIDKDRDPDRSHLSDALGYLVWQENGRSKMIGGKSMRLI